MRTVIGAKVEEDTAARLSKMALEKGVTVSEIVRRGIELLFTHNSSTELEIEQADITSRRRLRSMKEAKPREMFDGAMFIDRIRQLVNKEKKVLSDWHPLERDDYDHLIAMVEENVKVAEEYKEGPWIEKWLNRLIDELKLEREQTGNA